MIRVVDADKKRGMKERSERLRQARILARFASATKAADALGIAASTYRAHENGQNDFGVEDAERYGKAFKVSPNWLLTGQDAANPNASLTLANKSSPKLGMIPVKGSVKAGHWQDVDLLGGNIMNEWVTASSEYPLDWQYAYVVDGESLNKIARHGDRLICLDLRESGGSFSDGDLVIVERTRYSGQVYERTAKRVRQTLAGYELWPESDDPNHQEAIPYRGNIESDHVSVVARVLWILRKP